MIRVLAREPFVAATTDTFTLCTLWDLPLNTPAELVEFTDTLSARYRGRLQEFGSTWARKFPASSSPDLVRPGYFG